MRWFHQIRTQLETLRRSQAGRELDKELRFHLDQQIEENLAAGMSAEEARRAAIHRFGNLGVIQEETRSTWSWTSVELFFRDLGVSLRSLSRSPGLTSTALLVMALGLGGNIAIFAVIRSVFLKPLPFHEPSRLVALYQGQQRLHSADLPIDAASFRDWQQAAHNSAELAILDPFKQYDLSTSGGELPEKIDSGVASWNFFHVLGVQPALGRAFTASDDSLSATATVILMDSLWRRRFHGDPGAIGSEIRLNGRRYTVIGVMPPWFRYEGKRAGNTTQIWLPIYHEYPASIMETYREHEFVAIGRLAPGVTAASLFSQLNAVQRRIKAAHPGPAVRDNVTGHTLLDDAVSDYRTPMLIIFAATGCVLLIACLNVGSLLVARTAARRKELAIRAAVGARRMRLLRERFLESLLLSTGGGIGGMLIANAAISWLVHTRPDMNRVDGVHIDPIVVAFAVAAVAACALFSGLISVWNINGKSLMAPLMDSSRGNSGGHSRAGQRRALLAAEVGLTMMLLVGAGLLLKSYLRLRTTDLGISSDSALTMQFNLPDVRYSKGEQKAGFMEELLRKIRTVPGVEKAGLITAAPGQGWGGDYLTTILEHPPRTDGSGVDFLVRAADPGYFAAAGIPVLRGRTFDSGERLDRGDVIVISQEAANRFFPNEDPVGNHVRLDFTGQVFRVIGVAGDTRWKVDQPAEPTLYLPILGSGFGGNGIGFGTVFVRSGRDVETLSIPIQRVINGMDRDLPVSRVETLRETIEKSTLGSRFNSVLVLGFAVIALVLSAAGLYGVLAYLVTQRTNELGVRIALGAQRAGILRLVVLDGLRPAIFGLVFGLAGSAAAAKLIRTLLYGTEPWDSAVFLTVTTVLLAVAALPARFRRGGRQGSIRCRRCG
jgi:putative ABC transport system permease protein